MTLPNVFLTRRKPAVFSDPILTYTRSTVWPRVLGPLLPP